MKVLRTIMLSLMLLGSCNANAIDAYVGIGIGESYVDQGVFGEMDTAYKIFGGAQFHPNIAVEVAYMDLGKPHWEYDKTSQIGSLPPTSTSQSSNDFAWGLGISFDVGKKFAIPIEYEKIGTDLDNTAMFSVSCIYSF